MIQHSQDFTSEMVSKHAENVQKPNSGQQNPESQTAVNNLVLYETSPVTLSIDMSQKVRPRQREVPT